MTVQYSENEFLFESDRIKKELIDLMQTEKEIYLDMSQVKLLNSQAIAKLLSCKSKANEKQVEFHIVNVIPSLEDTFKKLMIWHFLI